MACSFAMTFSLFLMSGGNLCTLALSVLLMPIALFAVSKQGLMRKSNVFYAACGIISALGIFVCMLPDLLFAFLTVVSGVLIAAKSKNAPAYYAELCMFLIVIFSALRLFLPAGKAEAVFCTDMRVVLCAFVFCIAFACRNYRLKKTAFGYLLACLMYIPVLFLPSAVDGYASLFLAPMMISACVLPMRANTE